jgi:hypothetical protein
MINYRSRVYLGDYIRCREDVSNSYYSIPQVQNSSHHSVATSTNEIEQTNGANSNNIIITPTSTLQQIHQSSQPSNAPSNSNQQQTIAPSVP